MKRRLFTLLFILLFTLLITCAAFADGTIILSPDSILVTGTGVSVTGQQITITAGGTFEVTGTHPDAIISIDAGGSEVLLRLTNVSLTNPNSEAIVIAKGQPVVIDIPTATNSTIAAATSNPDQYRGVIRSKGDLTLTGNGTLQISGTGLSGIHTSKVLTVNGTRLEITADDNGLRAKKGIELENASLSITCGGKGLYAGDEEEDLLADVEAKDCILSVCSDADGIQAYGSIELEDSTLLAICGKNGLQASDEVELPNAAVLILSGKKAINCNNRPSLSVENSDIAAGSRIAIGLNTALLEGTAPANLDHLSKLNADGCSISVNGTAIQ